MNCEDKIKGKEDLVKTINLLKEQGKKIVHCHGCFDLIHPGHMRHLKFAKEQGDILLVSITDDDFILKEYKNPFSTSILRAKSLASIEYVDLVFIDEMPSATKIIEEIKPDVYIKGQEYLKERKDHPGFLKEKYIVEQGGGKIICSPGDLIFSSTKIIDILLKRDDAKEEKINNFLVRHKINKNILKRIVEGYENSKILVIGDLFIENYIFCDKPNISTESPVLSLNTLDYKRFLGGVGAITQYIDNLGGNVKALCFGDNNSRMIVNQINGDLQGKIDFIEAENYSLPIKKRFLSHEQKLFEVNENKKIELDEKKELEFINEILKIIDNFDGIIFCDYGFGSLTADIINSITNEIKERTILSTIITGNRREKNLINYNNIDFVVCSEEEARNSINNFSDSIDFLSRNILSKTRYKNLIINLGKEGLICYDPAKELRQPASTYVSYLPSFLSKAVDSVGEKEALVSSIALSLSSKADIYSATYIGNCISAIASSKLGIGTISKKELKFFLENKNHIGLQ